MKVEYYKHILEKSKEYDLHQEIKKAIDAANEYVNEINLTLNEKYEVLPDEIFSKDGDILVGYRETKESFMKTVENYYENR